MSAHRTTGKVPYPVPFTLGIVLDTIMAYPYLSFDSLFIGLSLCMSREPLRGSRLLNVYLTRAVERMKMIAKKRNE